MAKLDRTRSYGETFGAGGSCFVQDNRNFNFVGDEIDDQGNPVDAPAPPPASSSDQPDYGAKSDDELKAILTQFDEPWTTREAALTLLGAQ